jgi:hypothetical protein
MDFNSLYGPESKLEAELAVLNAPNLLASEPLLHTIDDFAPEPWQTLLCPQCSGEYTHVDEVTMKAASGQPPITLTGEGEDSSARISITHDKVHDGMPGRRHTMIIRIACENGCITDLELAQHKGNTFTLVCAIAGPSDEQDF